MKVLIRVLSVLGFAYSIFGAFNGIVGGTTMLHQLYAMLSVASVGIFLAVLSTTLND